MHRKHIDEIIDRVFELNPHIPREVALSLKENVSLPIREQLEKLYSKHPEDLIDKESLINVLRAYFIDSLVPFGESIGVISGQAVGEKQTQSNLNLFHTAGSGDKQPITSKFMEIINTTANPKTPSFNVYFNQEFKDIKTLRETIGNSFVEMTLAKMSKKISVRISKEDEEWFEAFYILYSESGKKKSEYFSDCLELTMDMNILYRWSITLEQIYQKLSEMYDDLYIMFSPDVYSKILIFVDSRGIEYPEEGEEKGEFVSRKGDEFFSESAVECYLDDVVKKTLRHVTLFGIKGINEIFYLSYIKKTNDAHGKQVLADEKYWFVETRNSTIKEETIKTKKGKLKIKDSVKRFKTLLNNPLVDTTKTISSNIWDIYHTFGIEATRLYIINTFEQMSGVNRCHVEVLVDKMVFTGIPTSITRYSMRTGMEGAITRSTFEESFENLLKASIKGETDNLKSVAASIVCGKIPRLGTGMCDIEYSPL